MDPLSYKNMDKKENATVFSDPEDNESDSSEKEDIEDFDCAPGKIVEAQKKVKPDPKLEKHFEGLFDEDKIVSKPLQLQSKEKSSKKKEETVKSKPEKSSDSDEYEASDSDEVPIQVVKPVNKRDIFAESSSSDEDKLDVKTDSGIDSEPKGEKTIKNLKNLF